jgi:hypothetical protein
VRPLGVNGLPSEALMVVAMKGMNQYNGERARGH